MKLTKEKQLTKKQLWNCPKITTMSAEHLRAKVVASACSTYMFECGQRFFRETAANYV